MLTVPRNEWLGGSNKNLTANGACGVPGRPPQYFALTALTGAMVQWALCFSETISCPSSISYLRLNKGGIMKMLLISLNFHLYGYAIYTVYSVYPRLWRYQFGFIVAVLCCAVVAKSLILPSLGSGYG